MANEKRPSSNSSGEIYNDVPELKSINDYNRARAKEAVSIQWLISKAYDGRPPEELTHLFYKGGDDEERLLPAVVNFLATGQAYLHACANVFGNPDFECQGFAFILQFFSRKGIYVLEQGVEVTEAMLLQTAPLKLGAHIVTIDALVTAYIHEVVNIQRVVQAVSLISPSFSPAEPPQGVEAGLILWINSVCETYRQKLAASGLPIPSLPVVKNLKEDLSDGQCLAALLSFYCPDYLKVSDITIKTPMSLADSIHNLQLVKRFCQTYLPGQPCILELEDIVFAPGNLRLNILALLVEIFHCMVVQPSDCVKEKRALEPTKASVGRSTLFTRTHRPMQVQVGAAQKRGLPSPTSNEIRSPGRAKSLGEEMELESVSSITSHGDEPLLPARLRQAKEKIARDSKDVERGEDAGRFHFPKIKQHNGMSSSFQDGFNGNTVTGTLADSNKGLSLTGESFTLHGGPNTSHHARAAGIPALDERVFGIKRDTFGQSPEEGFWLSKNGDKNSQTSFVEISKLGNSGSIPNGANSEYAVYVQHTADNKKPGKPEKEGSPSQKKKTTFAALPNQTTWAASARQQKLGAGSDFVSKAKPLNAELTNLRLRLEEKRKQMEIQRKKMEVSLNKHRQHMGKQAFLQVTAFTFLHEDAYVCERECVIV